MNAAYTSKIVEIVGFKKLWNSCTWGAKRIRLTLKRHHSDGWKWVGLLKSWLWWWRGSRYTSTPSMGLKSFLFRKPSWQLHLIEGYTFWEYVQEAEDAIEVYVVQIRTVEIGITGLLHAKAWVRLTFFPLDCRHSRWSPRLTRCNWLAGGGMGLK